jgi:hypothetical protein
MSFPSDPSLQRISFITTICDQIPELPKPCLMSAEEIALASSPGEIELFANQATANAMLTSLLEYETKLQRAFEKPESCAMTREQSLVFNTTPWLPHSPPHKTPLRSLPPATGLMSSGVFKDVPNFIDLLGIEEKRIAGYSLVHPVLNADQFNGAISEIVHLAKTMQSVLGKYNEYELVPIPGHAMISFGKDRRRLWYDSKKPQSAEIPSLQEAFQRFLRLCWMLLAESRASHPFHLDKLDDIDFVPLLMNPSHEREWDDVSKNVISMAKYFALYVQESVKAKLDGGGDGQTPDLLVFDGAATDVIADFTTPSSI